MNNNPAGTPNPLNPTPANGGGMDANPSILNATNSTPTPRSQTTALSSTPQAQTAINPQSQPNIPQQSQSVATPRTPRTAQPQAVDSRTISSQDQQTSPQITQTSLNNDHAQSARATPNTTPLQSSAGNQDPIIANTKIESLDPTGRQMEQAPNFTNAPKKSKTGLIIGITIGMLTLIAGAAAAWWFLVANAYNPVEKAIGKLLSDDAPVYSNLSGVITITPTVADSEVEWLEISFTSSINSSNLENNSQITATLAIADMNDITVEIQEIYSDSGNLYLKFDNVMDALDELGYGDSLGDTTTILEDIDGVWLKLSADELSSIANSSVSSNEVISCFSNLLSDRAESATVLLDNYKTNRFITVTNKNLPINAESNNLYRITLNGEKLTNYLNSIRNTNLAYNVYSCLSISNIEPIAINDTNKLLADLPAVYAEVDGSDNFTRFYLDYDLKDSDANLVMNLSINYPSGLNISEPSNGETVNLVETITSLLNSTTDSYDTIEYDTTDLDAE